MPCLLLIGVRRDETGKKVAECLYAGWDGIELEKAADEAARSDKKWEGNRFYKTAFPFSSPMPIDRTPIQQSTPKFPERKKAELPKIADQPEWRQKLNAENLKNRIKATQVEVPPIPEHLKPKTKGGGATIVNDGKNVNLNPMGPTIAEFVSAGYDPRNYPPKGFAPKSTAEEVQAATEKWVAENAERAGGTPVDVKVVKTDTNPPAETNAEQPPAEPPVEKPPVEQPPVATEAQANPPAETNAETAADGNGQKTKKKKGSEN